MGLDKGEIQTQKGENGPLAHRVHKNQLGVTKGLNSGCEFIQLLVKKKSKRKLQGMKVGQRFLRNDGKTHTMKERKIKAQANGIQQNASP